MIKMSFKNREGPKVTILSNSTTFTNRFLCLRFHTSCNGNITINGTFKVKKSEQRVKNKKYLRSNGYFDYFRKVFLNSSIKKLS